LAIKLFMQSEKRNLFFLISICAISFALVIPTIFNNIQDPNLIVYFNGDEGYLMDLIWSYYSGEIRASYHGSIDYGLEMVYLSDLAKLLSPWIHFSPGRFVLILRWIHLLALIGSLITLWFLVGRYFKKGWSQIACVSLLGVNSAFAYFVNNLKPDFLVLFFILLSFIFLFRFLEKPSYGIFILSIAFAALGMIIKFSGVFLLPVFVVAIYLSRKNPQGRELFPIRKRAGSYLAGLCTLFAFTPFLPIYFYVRKVTGLTYYQEFGLWQSVLKFKVLFFIWILLALLALFFLMPFFLSKEKQVFFVKLKYGLQEFNSHLWIIISLFFCCFFLLGIRWLWIPKHFIEAYSFFVLNFLGGTQPQTFSNFYNLSQTVLKGTLQRFISIDIFIFIPLFIYFWLEVCAYFKHSGSDQKRFFKRLILLVFLIPFFLLMLTPGRMTSYHLLPFFVVIFILIQEGMYLIKFVYSQSRALVITLQRIMVGCLSIAFILHGITTIQSRIRQFHQKEDMVFEFMDWWEKNIPLDAKIVADYYQRVYIPDKYKNIKTFRGYLEDKERLAQLYQLVHDERPRYVYYNRGACGTEPLPPLEKIMPRQKMQLVKTFDSAHYRYQRAKGDQFVIYQLIY